jgi:D-alanyl-D-alanine dipeptidase
MSAMRALIASVAALCFTMPALATVPQQALLVTTPDWTDIGGVAQRYERGPDGHWQAVGEAFQIVVGKTGLAWGLGLTDTAKLEGPRKQEGDGKAPAGVFSLVSAFGYGASVATKLPYRQLSDGVECVDDPKSAHYNTLVDGTRVVKDWDSSEHMHRTDELYRYGVFVAHNTPPEPGKGSCIFLHIWRGSHEGTVGCTAMAESDILGLLAWLDPKKSPVLIQLPASQYETYRRAWDLPYTPEDQTWD